jgi:hypothetical protein
LFLASLVHLRAPALVFVSNELARTITVIDAKALPWREKPGSPPQRPAG